MFPDDSNGSFDKYPENKSGPSGSRLAPFSAQVVEGLLHRLPQSLPEAMWIESEEFLVESAKGLWLKDHVRTSLDKGSAAVRS